MKFKYLNNLINSANGSISSPNVILTKNITDITNSTVTIGESPASRVQGGTTYFFDSRKSTLSLGFSTINVLFSVSIYKNNEK